MITRISLAETAHNLVREHLRQGMTAIDATLGNGHDTLFLAQSVGESGRVYGFDIQAQALQATRLRLQQHGMASRATLLLASHAEMDKQLPEMLHGSIQVIMFNLGYLPGADKQVITQADITIRALNTACRLLASQGVMTVMAYPGHAGGDEEAARVEQWLSALDPARFEYRLIFSQRHQNTAPRLFVIRKLG